MPDLTPDEREAEIARLEQMLASSRAYAGGGGYKERIAAIEARLTELRGE